VLVLGLLVAPGAQAVTCSVTGATLPFAGYNPLDTLSTTVIAQVKVHCEPNVLEALLGVTMTAALSAGSSGSAIDRTARQGGQALHYNVYLDPGLQQLLGDGTVGSTVPSVCLFSVLCGAKSDYNFALYGAMPPRQDVGTGPYADTLLLILNF
jgi:spore coat protein U-like protein